MWVCRACVCRRAPLGKTLEPAVALSSRAFTCTVLGPLCSEATGRCKGSEEGGTAQRQWPWPKDEKETQVSAPQARPCPSPGNVEAGPSSWAAGGRPPATAWLSPALRCRQLPGQWPPRSHWGCRRRCSAWKPGCGRPRGAGDPNHPSGSWLP